MTSGGLMRRAAVRPGAALLGVSERISDQLMHADMMQTYVRSSKGYIILNRVGSKAALVMLTTEDAKLGLVFSISSATCPS